MWRVPGRFPCSPSSTFQHSCARKLTKICILVIDRSICSASPASWIRPSGPRGGPAGWTILYCSAPVNQVYHVIRETWRENFLGNMRVKKQEPWKDSNGSFLHLPSQANHRQRLTTCISVDGGFVWHWQGKFFLCLFFHVYNCPSKESTAVCLRIMDCS